MATPKYNPSKLPSQRDIDSELLPLDDPMGLFWRLATMATWLIVIITWLALLAIMTAGWIAWSFWPFVVVPIGLWVLLLAGPALFLTRRGALSILSALAQTAEGWLQRAGYSIDLNRDGYIGRVQPITAPTVEEIRPVLVSGGARMLPQDAPIIPEFDAIEETGHRLQLRRKVWELPQLDRLPQPLKVPEETVTEFIDGVFGGIGWSRATWVEKGGSLDRDTYDSLIALLETSKLLTGRKPGSKGKLSCRTPQAARAVLGLPTR